MPGRKIQCLRLSKSERRELEVRLSQAWDSSRMVERVKIVLCRANGLSCRQTAVNLDCSEAKVSKWTTQYRKLGLSGLEEKADKADVQKLPEEIVAKILAKTAELPKGALRWTTRLMATEVGVAPSAVSRVWREHGASPEAEQDRDHSSSTRSVSQIPDSFSEDTGGVGGKATQRLVAKMAGVSPMTVSRALGNHPNVREEVRERIVTLAQQIGYRPDPELGKLMVHLRKRPSSRTRVNICSLEEVEWGCWGFDHYFRPLVNGARQRAERLGYTWTSFSMEEFLHRPDRSLRILKARGTEGIFITPAIRFCHLPSDVDWSGFSVVAATHSIESPVFHRVVPHHFRNMLRLCEVLRNRGFQRLGLAIPMEGDCKVGSAFAGGFAAFHASRRISSIPPLLYGDDYFGELRAWFRRESPDALIVHAGSLGVWIAKALSLPIPGPVPIAVITHPESDWAGMDEHPELIGASAVEFLGKMIMHGERGIPRDPSTVMIDGVWLEGKSVPGSKSKSSLKSGHKKGAALMTAPD